MTYTALKLINNSFRIAQVNPRSLQTITGPEEALGLDLLNELISMKSVKTRMIPYYTYYEFVTVPGQEEYFIPGLIQTDTLTFNIGEVRFPSGQASRDIYFGSGRADNITSLPVSWEIERAYVDGQDGSIIRMYFKPDQVYPIKIMAKFALTQVPNIVFDMSSVYPLYYISYLKYALAEYLCVEYAMTFPPKADEKLKEKERNILDVEALDLAQVKTSSFAPAYMLSLPGISLYKGFWPAQRS